MGKQKIYVNGKLAKEHFGGYLPVIVNLKEQGLKKGDKCVVAVMADNSNDKSYPPGKPQYTLTLLIMVVSIAMYGLSIRRRFLSPT